jgi:hypothetical protein
LVHIHSLSHTKDRIFTWHDNCYVPGEASLNLYFSNHGETEK